MHSSEIAKERNRITTDKMFRKCSFSSWQLDIFGPENEKAKGDQERELEEPTEVESLALSL